MVIVGLQGNASGSLRESATRNSLSLFATLFRLAHRQEENFVTEAFVWVLNLLLERQPDSSLRIVSQLLYGNVESNSLGGNLVVRTQEVTPEGRPDICIESDNLLAYIEVKVGSELGATQIDRYLAALKATAGARERRLVLLTQWAVAFEVIAQQPDQHARWHEVADWLRIELQHMSDDVVSFLVQELIDFLENTMVTIDHVGWEYSNGVVAMQRLAVMIERALELAEIPIYRKTAGWDWIGYYTGDSTQVWVGVRYKNPTRLLMAYEAATGDREVFDSLPERLPAELPLECAWNGGKISLHIDLDDERIHFFALSKESQLAKLTTFIQQAYPIALRCIVQEGTTASG